MSRLWWAIEELVPEEPWERVAALLGLRSRAVIDALMTVTLLSPGQGARKFDPGTVRIDWKGPQQ